MTRIQFGFDYLYICRTLNTPIQVENQDRFPRNASDVVFSKRIKAGRRRTYFFDVRSTRGNDYYLTITESKKRPDDTYEKHKVFLYKEDFNKFLAGLNDAVNHVKNDLMPDFDFTQFDRPEHDENNDGYNNNYNRDYNANPNSFDNRSQFTNIPQNGAAPLETNDDYDANAQQPGVPGADYNANAPVSDDDLKW